MKRAMSTLFHRPVFIAQKSGTSVSRVVGRREVYGTFATLFGKMVLRKSGFSSSLVCAQSMDGPRAAPLECLSSFYKMILGEGGQR